MRISVVGTSGSGKTTLGRRAAARLGVPFVELDGIRHQAGWVELPDDEFRARVAEVVAGDAWVVDGDYSEPLGDLVRARATTVVWVDPSRPVLMVQVVGRSLRRAVTRQELWNGNRERWRGWADPTHPIRWAWATHAPRRVRYEAAADDRWVRVRTRRAATAWVAQLPAGVGRTRSPLRISGPRAGHTRTRRRVRR